MPNLGLNFYPSLTVKTAPSVEPVTTAEAKSHSRVDTTADDTLIASYIKAARQWCEKFTGRSFITTTFEYRIPDFEAEIILPRPPLLAISSIAYIDANGSPQTLASSVYQTNIYSVYGSVKEAYGQTWPTTRSDDYNAVTITYTAGYGSATTNVPEDIRIAILQLVGHWYENREPELTGTISKSLDAMLKALLWPYKVSVG